MSLLYLGTKSPRAHAMSHSPTRRGDSVLSMLILCTLLIIIWGVHSFISDVLSTSRAL